MERKLGATAVLFAFVLLVIHAVNPIAAYIDSVKTGNAGVRKTAGAAAPNSGRQEFRSWQERISHEAANLRIEPIDAKIDPIWKAVPGYNGIEVDIDKTLQLALERPLSDSIPFVYREVRPAVELDDLPPAPVYRGNPHKPMTALMFHVAWGDEYLPELLDALKEADVRATFFLSGGWLAKHREMAARIAAEGHELSNRGYSAGTMSGLSRAQIYEEISETEKMLEELGVKNKWFSPPYGDYDERMVRIAHGMGLRTVLWTLDAQDWKTPDPQRIISNVRDRLEPGTLVLLHPTEAALKALPEIVEIARQKGLAAGTVGETLASSRVPGKPGGAVERKAEF